LARTVKLVIQYDGTDFVGWQRQGRGVSIQGLIEDALARIDGAPVVVHGAGRTDAGAHALGQVASARLVSATPDGTLLRAMNANLPDSIRIVEAATVPDGFHARFSAKGKAYEYRIWNGPVVPPFTRLYAWHVTGRLNLEAMREAALAVPGEHDFAGFRGAGAVNHTTVRRITSAGWRVQPDGLLVFDIEGTGFLRYMVRSLVGMLVEIGRGQRPLSDMAERLAVPDRSAAGRTAPARGLFLVKVAY
jgi:tRNA pseudouridine38-40 synthase